MNRKRNSTYALLLVLTILLCVATVILYINAKDLLDRAEHTYAEAEDLFAAAEILQERTVTAQRAVETAEPDQTTTQAYTVELVTLAQRAEEKQEEAVPEAPQISMGTYTITAYCPCEICCGAYALTRPRDENGEPIVYTASGARAEAGVTIAVDPSVIPHGTSVWFEGPEGVQEYKAQDTGGAVNGNHIDLYFNSHMEALAWGSQTREVFVNQTGGF